VGLSGGAGDRLRTAGRREPRRALRFSGFDFSDLADSAGRRQKIEWRGGFRDIFSGIFGGRGAGPRRKGRNRAEDLEYQSRTFLDGDSCGVDAPEHLASRHLRITAMGRGSSNRQENAQSARHRPR